MSKNIPQETPPLPADQEARAAVALDGLFSYYDTEEDGPALQTGEQPRRA